MANIFNWNCRGLGQLKKRKLISDYILEHKIGILSIQETKIENFRDRTLNSICKGNMKWFYKSSEGTLGNSGGILAGIDSSIYDVLDVQIFYYSVTIHLKNKSEQFTWYFTSVYAPVLSQQRSSFLNELQTIFFQFTRFCMVGLWRFQHG